jgi:hypothetical protein
MNQSECGEMKEEEAGRPRKVEAEMYDVQDQRNPCSLNPLGIYSIASIANAYVYYGPNYREDLCKIL